MSHLKVEGKEAGRVFSENLLQEQNGLLTLHRCSHSWKAGPGLLRGLLSVGRWGLSDFSQGEKRRRAALCRSFLSAIQLPTCVRLACDPRGCTPPGPSAYGTSQARILERVAISLSIYPTQRSHLCLLRCRWTLPPGHQESLAVLNLLNRRAFSHFCFNGTSGNIIWQEFKLFYET